GALRYKSQYFGVGKNRGKLPGTLYAYVHTHGRGSYNFSDEVPGLLGGTGGDKYLARKHSIYAFLVNRGGELKSFNPFTEQVIIEKSDLPGSLGKPIINYDIPLNQQTERDAIDYTDDNE